MKKGSTRFTINGKEYASYEELPEEFKAFFKDENNNGIPDIAENLGTEGTFSSVTNTTIIEIDGKKYSSWDDVPEAYQAFRPKEGSVVPVEEVVDSELTYPKEPAHKNKFRRREPSNTTSDVIMRKVLPVVFVAILLAYLVYRFF